MAHLEKVFVAGHAGMAGSAICKKLKEGGYENVVTRTHAELELCDQHAVKRFFDEEAPEIAIIAAARVGGIHANNTYPVEFLHDNLAIATNIITEAFRHKCKRLVFLGSNCIYPRECPQPIKEEYLLTGPLEPTNEAYAIGKIAGLKYCSYYRKEYGALFYSLMPANLYGKNDNYHPENSHVFPALIRRFHECKERGDKEIVIWGSGNPIREFMHADDLADFTVFSLKIENPPDWVNVGIGTGITIRDLAITMKEVIGFEGEIVFDTTKLDGMPAKYLDTTRLSSLGWEPKIDLRTGIEDAYKHFLEERKTGLRER